MSSVEKINNRIAECLAGNGDYSTLQALRREKTELLDREHFEKIKSLREEIRQIEETQVELREMIDNLEIEKKQIAIDEDIHALRLQQVRESHAEKNAEIYLKRLEEDTNRKAIIELDNVLDSLIKSKIAEVK